jgi:RNA polymerase sigma-70 factor (ECF subfamily)
MSDASHGGLDSDRSLQTNTAWLEDLRGRQEEAWRDLYQRYTGYVTGYVLKHGGSPQVAEEIVQQVFVELVEAILKFEHRGPGTFRHWLKQRVKWRLADHIKRARHGADVPIDDHEPEAPEEDTFPQEMQEQVRLMARRKLGPRDSQIIEGLLNGRSPAEIAAELGMRRNHFDQRKHLSVKALRGHFHATRREVV